MTGTPEVPQTYTQEQVELIRRAELLRERTITGMTGSVHLLKVNGFTEEVVAAMVWYSGYIDLVLAYHLKEQQKTPEPAKEAEDASKEE